MSRNWHWNPKTQNVEFGVTGYTAAMLGLFY